MRLAKQLILTWVVAISAGGVYAGIAAASSDTPVLVADSFY